MKKFFSILILLSICFSLIACNDEVGNKPSPSKNSIYPTPEKQLKSVDTEELTVSFFAESNGYFYRDAENFRELFYIKGVNMGLTEPTTDLNNPNVSYDTYYNWFTDIIKMNCNTVRVFTIMNPNFYKAFYDFNKENYENPLYLIQGIWFSEDLMYTLTDALESDEILISAFKRNVKETLDIIHGNSDYTQYGEFSPAIYDRDISKYVVGYILGLEYPAEFVIETNASHPDLANFDGKYLKTEKGSSPFEAFLCNVGDYLISYETQKYHYQVPVAFLNWQPLDVLKHTNEPFKDDDDAVSVNTENIKATDKFFAGLFAAVDVYPYYPEFMNYQPEYVDYRDENGEQDVFRAYLKDLKKEYTVPLLVAEYGLPTSRGMAHLGVNGYNQGGITEQEQGKLVSKMTKGIALEGCCGGLMFSWQDEWFKRTWNTVMFYPDNPSDRTHNLSSAEQSYGFVSFDVSSAYPDGDYGDWYGVSQIEDTGIMVQYDADYMHVYTKLPKDFDFERDTFYMPISVKGFGSTSAKEQSLTFDRPVDFLLVINGKNNTRLLTDAYYDVFHYKYAVLRGVFGRDKSTPYSPESGIYNKINTFVANEMYLPLDDKTLEPKYYESGLLTFGNTNPESEDYSSMADFYYKDGRIEIRIPWYLLNVMNPRTGTCIDEFKAEDITFTDFDSVYIGAGTEGEITLYNADFAKIKDVKIKQRLKKSYYIVADTLKEIDIGQ